MTGLGSCAAQQAVERKSHVLLVDDEEALRRAVARSLESAGFLVTHAATGAQALEALKGAAFDVIVTDITMPEMTGLELLRAVRERDLDVPVILVTGYADLPNGSDPSLPRLNKPYRQQELADLITTLAAEQRRKMIALVREPAAE